MKPLIGLPQIVISAFFSRFKILIKFFAFNIITSLIHLYYTIFFGKSQENFEILCESLYAASQIQRHVPDYFPLEPKAPVPRFVLASAAKVASSTSTDSAFISSTNINCAIAFVFG